MASTGNHGPDGYARSGRRPSAAVYRRRRLAVAILALLLLAALAVGALAVTGAFRTDDGTGAGAPTSSATDAAASGDPTPAATTPAAAPSVAPTPTPTPTSAPGPSATATATPAADCDTAVVVRAETDAPSYAAGEDPVLSLVVRNEGTAACEVNVGTSQMEFVLTNDGERVFSSVDCQEDSQDLERTIQPGGEERATFTWARNRTVPECTVVEEEPAAGEYTLVTRLGSRSSEPVEFTLD